MSEGITIVATCHECEHEGDMGNYLYDLRKSGAEILGSSINHDEETGEITMRIPDAVDFMQKFKNTDSYGFVSLPLA